MDEQLAMPALGYDPVGGGGISNQKMAFIGLLLAALEHKQAIVLPRFRVMDQITRRYAPREFSEIYEAGPIRELCAAWHIPILEAKPESLVQGYDKYFWKTYAVIHNMNQTWFSAPAIAIRSILKSLRPRIRTSFLMQALSQALSRIDPDFCVAQFRIESDWKKHCDDNLKARVPADEDIYLPHLEIIGKIVNGFGPIGSLYVACDEAALPQTKWQMKEEARAMFSVSLLFKSDFLSSFEQETLTELHLSLLDFELATFARRFVGISRSTFSCLATLERCCREDRLVRGHFIYNAAGPVIRERTDNGCVWDASLAIAAREGSG